MDVYFIFIRKLAAISDREFGGIQKLAIAVCDIPHKGLSHAYFSRISNNT